MRTVHACVMFVAVAVGLAGCGETISADQRVERCLSKQPDATKAECMDWEKAGELEDNGRHQGHESM